ncbi:hypothetical protein TREMEDRAFT_58053 [Tremella mesenterica DSM 1558]|uniref:uncharacterized protein n=1 Tax=Tremella mesenterica (strain ATCC 24925 / CBS 8224 / DSM 1558 / NBRC 9311 / NRRL Y-6157 / RJB 2259-6 / UBC 559-6) TaxID=578456 RepID=UPI0003F49EA7|nr:uncharacterized protein TREMEDRAFT_58053 [Tremella mesenterica DSM 1558]EIW71918.1 hypothetical protein TREMEDRAFT_58053 [Tremella mesenterica DSM 1558]
MSMWGSVGLQESRDVLIIIPKLQKVKSRDEDEDDVNTMTQVITLYRSFLQHLQLLPDPHIWWVLVPRYRSLLQSASPERKGESSSHPLTTCSTSKESKKLRLARKELRQLKAAVSCHPHALTRLLEDVYGQREKGRFLLLNNVRRSWLYHHPNYPPSTIPPPLIPLLPPPAEIPVPTARARTAIPQTAIRKAEKRRLKRDWEQVKVPLVLPPMGSSYQPQSISASPSSSPPLSLSQLTLPSLTAPSHEIINVLPDFNAESKETSSGGVGTGWENRNIPESLYLLASPPSTSRFSPRSLPTFQNLILDYPHLARIFPKTRKRRKVKCPLPRPGETRQNPRTWSRPIELSDRLLKRTYGRIWEKTVWVKPTWSVQKSGRDPGVLNDGREREEQIGKEMEEKWVECGWEDVRSLLSLSSRGLEGNGARHISRSGTSESREDDNEMGQDGTAGIFVSRLGECDEPEKMLIDARSHGGRWSIMTPEEQQWVSTE